MTERLLKVLPLGVFGALIAVLTAGFSPAQDPIPLRPPVAPGVDPEPIPLPLPGKPAQPAQPEAADGPEVLAKGPIHEAFAATAEAPTASPIVAKQPPEPIEELPPDQKPAGDNVQWIPGYWHWDEEASRFIWISGFWRQPPPGRVWVPGSWREAKGGWQWVPGFWQEVNQQPAQPNVQAQPEIEYLPEPPASLEVGPTVAAPNSSHFYVPGSWVWRGRYLWRPGVWVEYRPSWVWVPARYHWTPAGYVFCDGFWDHPIATRGVLFAPVVFARPVRPAYVYTPVYVVSEPALVGALFVRRGYSHYYFGDYYDARYATVGYSAWCGTYTRTGFTVGFGVGRSWGYDPLWSYYSVTYRDTPTWHRGVGDLYHGRYRGDLVRPPTTLVQQNTVINNVTKTNVTNVTNNITVINGMPTVNNRDVSNVAMVAPLKVAPDLSRTKFESVNADTRRNEAAAARQIREVGAQRGRLETAAVTQAPVVRPPTPGQPVVAAQPRSIKLDVPKTAVARAQVPDEKKAPPPNPLRASGPGAKTDPPKVDPRPPVSNPLGVTPKVDVPKIDPKPPVVLPKTDPPRVDPKPKVDPKPPVGGPINPLPKIDPPKVDPKVPPTVQPRVDPKPPATLPKVDLPKTDPKLPVPPPVVGPKVDPKPPVVSPKVDPKPPVTVPRIDPPKVDPKPPVVLPKVDPKPPSLPPVSPRIDPKPPTLPPAAPLPKVDPKPPVVVPRIDPKPNPPPVVLPKVDPKPRVDPPKPTPKADPPKPAPVVVAPPLQPKPAPVANPPAQPRPAVLVPANQPPKVVQPPKVQPRVEQPKPQPAPPGKPPAKGKGRSASD